MTKKFKPKLSPKQWNEIKLILDDYNLKKKKGTGRPKASDKSVLYSLLWLIHEQDSDYFSNWKDIPKYTYYAKKATTYDRFLEWTDSSSNIFSKIWSAYLNNLPKNHRAWLRNMIAKQEKKLIKRGLYKHIKF